MSVQTAVQQQLAFWHGTLDPIMGDCSPEVLNKNLPDATISSIGSIYAHIAWSEDAIVNGMLQGKPAMYQTDGWEAKTGVPFPGDASLNPQWTKAFKMDAAKFRDYAKAVFANTESYVGNLSDGDLARKVQTPIGEQTVEWAIATLLGTHLPQHIGEIAAVKGVQGLKGLPF